MKKSLLYVACSCLPMFIPIGSCDTPEYDDLESAPLELSISGLDFQRGDDEFTLEATASAEGVVFTVTATSESQTYGFLYSASVDEWYNPETFGLEPFVDFVGDWGSVKYLSDEEPYQMQVTVNQNETGQERLITLEFGAYLFRRWLQITQPATSTLK